MTDPTTVIASGNLASSQRTITGLLGQLVFLGVDDRDALELFTDAGLPARALEEPDFPISLEQELVICMALVRRLGNEQSAVRVFFENTDNMGIENLGVLGMAMRHAATAVAALQVCLNFPQLTFGHSRLVVSQQPNASLFTFNMQRPEIRDASTTDIDRLVEYCLALDLVTSLRNIQDIVDSQEVPLYITFPFPEPADWHLVQEKLPCPVEFSGAEACLAFPAAFDDAPLPRANPLVYRSYVSIAEKLSLMLAEEISLTERVTRWLWAYTPPLKRGELASQLAMSERSLTRQLGKEGTSYAALLAGVQSERARNYLRNPCLTVSEIGYRLGYTEPATFTRAFTKWTGSSPLKWRKHLVHQGSIE
jgi:AraC-like DNA-binding protein